MRGGRKLRIAVFKLTSCSGCQLQFLNMEDELLELTDKVEFSHFLEASREVKPGPYDIAFIEGSVSTPDQVVLVERVRRESRVLVALGACATGGGIQALRNWLRYDEVVSAVYPRPEFIKALERSRPVSEVVKVDYELRGCPVSKDRLLSFIKQLMVGRRPYLRRESLCSECRRSGNVCVMIAKGVPCLGPITQEGCGGICPSFGRGCYGCFGPSIDSRVKAFTHRLRELGLSDEEVVRLLKGFTSWSKEIREAIKELGGGGGG